MSLKLEPAIPVIPKRSPWSGSDEGKRTKKKRQKKSQNCIPWQDHLSSEKQRTKRQRRESINLIARSDEEFKRVLQDQPEQVAQIDIAEPPYGRRSLVTSSSRFSFQNSHAFSSLSSGRQTHAYDEQNTKLVVKWASRLQVEMKSQLFDPADPMSSYWTLHAYRMACDMKRVHQGAAMWLALFLWRIQ